MTLSLPNVGNHIESAYYITHQFCSESHKEAWLNQQTYRYQTPSAEEANPPAQYQPPIETHRGSGNSNSSQDAYNTILNAVREANQPPPQPPANCRTFEGEPVKLGIVTKSILNVYCGKNFKGKAIPGNWSVAGLINFKAVCSNGNVIGIFAFQEAAIQNIIEHCGGDIGHHRRR